jgi:hypothetical protein
MGDVRNVNHAVVKMNPISWAQKAHHIIVCAIIEILDNNFLPDNRGNNHHRKHHDGELNYALEHPKHKDANAA